MKNDGQLIDPAACAAERAANVVVSQVFAVMLYVYVAAAARTPQYRMRSPLFSMTNIAFAEGVTVHAGTV